MDQLIHNTATSKKAPHFAKTNNEDDKPASEDNIPDSLRQQLIKGRIRDVEDPSHKNPFAFTHPLDQQAATFAKAKRIIGNPAFAKLDDSRKSDILGRYYDKYVIPVYANAKLDAPHKDVWVREIQKNFFKTSDFYEYSAATNKDSLSDLASGVSHAQAGAVAMAGHVGHAIIMAGVRTDRKILGLANFFPGSALHSWATEQADFDARLSAPEAKFSQDVIDRATFWLDTHPSRTFTEKAGSFVGESLVQLPMYEAIGGPLSAMGKAVTSTGEVGRAANLTRRLAASRAGQFVGRRLNEAASAYIGDVFSETPQGERATDMAAWMGFGIGTEALGKLAKPIAKNAIKKVIATNVAIGGKVFHETVADQAELELIHGIVGTDAAGNPILHEEGKFEQQMQAAKEADPVKHSVVTAEKISQNAMAQQLYGKPLRNLSQLQRRKVRSTLARMTAEATQEIPIHVPEVAHHEVAQSIQRDIQTNPELKGTFSYLEKKYGAKLEDVLVQEEQASVAVESGIKSSQGSTKRVGRNEEVLASPNKKLGANRKEFALRTPEQIESTKPKVDPKTEAQQVFNELSDTGNMRYNSGEQGYNVRFASPVDKVLYRLNSTTKAARASRPFDMSRLRKYLGKTDDEIYAMAKQVKDQLDAEIRSRRKSYYDDPTAEQVDFPKMFEKLKEEGNPRQLQKDDNKDIEYVDLPKSYTTFKRNAVANFINPFYKGSESANKNLGKFLEDMDDKDFIQEISDQMGNSIHFEKPHDMLLWGLHFSKDLPSPLTKKIKETLANLDPDGNLTSWKDEARRLGAHIDMLAMSGRLETEGNVFRSTITTSFTGRTKWQREAEKEAAIAEVENYKDAMAPYAKNYKAEYQAGLKELAKLQSLRRAASTDEDFFGYHDQIKKVLENAENR